MMIEIIGTLAPLTFSMDGKANLCIQTKNDCRTLFDDFKDKPLTVKIKEYKKKRSLNANSYMWVLIGKLSEELNLNGDEIYRNYVKEVGIYKEFDIEEVAVNTLFHSWSLNGNAWFGEKIDQGKHENYSRVRLYYGSSVYNTKQMSRLVDCVVQDCRAVGIETISTYELEALMSNWRVK